MTHNLIDCEVYKRFVKRAITEDTNSLEDINGNGYLTKSFRIVHFQCLQYRHVEIIYINTGI